MPELRKYFRIYCKETHKKRPELIAYSNWLNSTNVFLKTTVLNNVSVFEFIDIRSGRLYICFAYVLPEDGHRSGPKHVVS
jgi:hypothetical protein